jgi:hypothetical protein
VSENIKKTITLDDLEKRHIESHYQPYFDWIRHVVSLSVAALTALISLQGSYLPIDPVLPILLAACWAALLSTILLGILALRTQYKTPLAAAQKIQNQRRAHGDFYAASQVKRGQFHKPPRYHYWVVRLMVLSFVFALSSLCIFAIANLLNSNA